MACPLEAEILARGTTLNVGVQPLERHGQSLLWTVSGGIDRDGIYRIGQGRNLAEALAIWDALGAEVAA